MGKKKKKKKDPQNQGHGEVGGGAHSRCRAAPPASMAHAEAAVFGGAHRGGGSTVPPLPPRGPPRPGRLWRRPSIGRFAYGSLPPPPPRPRLTVRSVTTCVPGRFRPCWRHHRSPAATASGQGEGGRPGADTPKRSAYLYHILPLIIYLSTLRYAYGSHSITLSNMRMTSVCVFLPPSLCCSAPPEPPPPPPPFA